MHQGGRKLGNWKLEFYLNHDLKRNCFGHYKKLADSRSYIYTLLIRKPCSVKTTKSMSQKVYKGNFTEVKTWDFHNFSVKQVTIGSHSFWSRIWSPINLITLIFKKKIFISFACFSTRVGDQKPNVSLPIWLCTFLKSRHLSLHFVNRECRCYHF